MNTFQCVDCGYHFSGNEDEILCTRCERKACEYEQDVQEHNDRIAADEDFDGS